ncbi:hypothetical protein [Candidatus Thiodictyon syntrophicum]|uniref:hypothetical protein n=1 Tax=Candidatus Thiodictyon syntrophicum TaxID=1166950 RepID=UPI0012FD19C7|nr:hypothetical protein [Candidatus Thiodictyon syntrophicum]
MSRPLGEGGHLQAQIHGDPLGAGLGCLCNLQGFGCAFGLGLCRAGPALGFCGVLTRPVQGPTQTGRPQALTRPPAPAGPLGRPPEGLNAPGAFLGLAVGLLECRPCLVALGLNAGSRISQILDLPPQGLKVAADLAQLRGGLPGLPAQVPKFRILGLAAAAPFLGQRPLFRCFGRRLLVPLAFFGEVFGDQKN